MNLHYSRIVLLSIQISFLLLVNAGLSFGGVPMTVVVNKSVLLTLKNPARLVTIADPEIIAVPEPLQRKQLLINGKKIGATNLIVWEDDVEKPTFFDIQVVGDRDLIETQIREYAPDDDITVQYARETVVLSGTVANEQTGKKAEEIAKAYSVKVLNHIRVDSPQQVLLQVKVAQIDKTSLKKLGISAIVAGNTAEGFSNLIGAPRTATTTITSSRAAATSTVTGPPGINGSGPSGIGGFDPLDAFQLGVSYFPAGIGAVLQALSTKGLAKILAEPNLLVKSGDEGNFLAGSRIPYSVLISTGGAATSSIVFETVGIKLKFKPEVMENGLIRLKIDPAEVSSIAGTLAVNGYPIIDTRDVRTTVELRDGESLVLAGLLQEEQIKLMSKIPLLGDIPILGALFRSTQDDLTEKELVFFITPKIAQPNAPGVKTVLPTDQELTPEQEKELRWIPLGD
ncbi:MAG: pilus assembly protein CpaC [Geobacteraceae bacterium GWC2_58_44]|nr:MAG: pilus assembly protein CpaC [Geobacteraceae bacterium GWC2_58_44]HBG07417.1 pilus assembly protein CpaC [Geobacter sp.]